MVIDLTGDSSDDEAREAREAYARRARAGETPGPNAPDPLLRSPSIPFNPGFTVRSTPVTFSAVKTASTSSDGTGSSMATGKMIEARFYLVSLVLTRASLNMH